MALDKKYPCQFCGEEFITRSSRKTHNRKCDKNVDRERNQKLSMAAQARRRKWEEENPRPTMDPDTFADIFDDLPDGAFFAMAEEHGIMPEDFI